MRILVDTNILVRSVERAHPLMRVSRDALRQLYEENHELCVTPQVVGEFWNVCTRPTAMNGLGNDIATTDRLVSRIEALFTLLPDSLECFRQWRVLLLRYQVKGVKVHDTHLVASAITHNASRLLTFNAADFRRYTNITVIDPLSLLP